MAHWLTESVDAGYSLPFAKYTTPGASVITCSTPTKGEMPSKFHNSDISLSMIQENSHPRPLLTPPPKKRQPGFWHVAGVQTCAFRSHTIWQSAKIFWQTLAFFSYISCDRASIHIAHYIRCYLNAPQILFEGRQRSRSYGVEKLGFTLLADDYFRGKFSGFSFSSGENRDMSEMLCKYYCLIFLRRERERERGFF
uniref:Uncharacterized protein n=2 Tax=Cacopsylla melanoneura TaxID=428564 RepID=A0A8D9A1C1_9HEMI